MEQALKKEAEVQICPVIELFNEIKKTELSEEHHLICEEKYDANRVFGSVYYFHHHQV